MNFKKEYSKLDVKEVKVLDLVNFVGGSQPPKSEHLYEKKDGYVRFIQNRDYNTENHITYIKKSKKNKICTRYDIMMDKYGEAGKVRFGIEGAYNVALAKIEPQNYFFQEYIREYFSQTNIEKYLTRSSIASTRASVSEENLNNLYIKLPEEKMLEEFQKIHHSITEYILQLKDENEKLNEIKQNYLLKFFQ